MCDSQQNAITINRLIAEALQNPDQVFSVYSCQHTRAADAEMLEQLKQEVSARGIKTFRYNTRNQFVNGEWD